MTEPLWHRALAELAGRGTVRQSGYTRGDLAAPQPRRRKQAAGEIAQRIKPAGLDQPQRMRREIQMRADIAIARAYAAEQDTSGGGDG